MLQQVTDGEDVGLSKQSLLSAWVPAGMISSPTPQHHLCHQSASLQDHPGHFTPYGNEKGTGPVLWLTHPQGWFSHNYTFRDSSTMLPRQGGGTTLPSAATEKWSKQLSWSYNFRSSSPPCLNIDGDRGEDAGISPQPMPPQDMHLKHNFFN